MYNMKRWSDQSALHLRVPMHQRTTDRDHCSVISAQCTVKIEYYYYILYYFASVKNKYILASQWEIELATGLLSNHFYFMQTIIQRSAFSQSTFYWVLVSVLVWIVKSIFSLTALHSIEPFEFRLYIRRYVLKVVTRIRISFCDH